MHAQRFADDGVDCPARVERGKRVLEDHLRLAANGQPFVALCALHVMPGDVGVATGSRVQAQQRAPGGGLAAAALAHQPQRLAAVDLERNAVHGAYLARHPLHDQPLADGEVLLQIDDADEGGVAVGGLGWVGHHV